MKRERLLAASRPTGLRPHAAERMKGCGIELPPEMFQTVVEISIEIGGGRSGAPDSQEDSFQISHDTDHNRLYLPVRSDGGLYSPRNQIHGNAA